jgi:two-component system LytT family response regulator
MANGTEMIRTLIVDDEPLARRALTRLLSEEPDISIIGECADGLETIAAIKSKNPDLVFLDVQMPRANGLKVLNAIDKNSIPIVVIVTAYDHYAVDAFTFQVFDYILKPLREERVKDTLRRVRAQLRIKREQPGDHQLQTLTEEIKYLKGAFEEKTRSRTTQTSYADRFAIKTSGSITYVRVEDITWVEAWGDYVRLHCKIGTHVIREKIGEIERRLNPATFIRIHRSTIVQINCVKQLRPVFHGDYLVILQNNTQLRLSRNYRNRASMLIMR